MADDPIEQRKAFLKARMQADAQELYALERLQEERARLRVREQRSSVNKMDAAAHAFATSRGRSGDALVQAANGARLTLRELAKKAGVSVAALSMARRGERKIRAEVAAKIQELTGFKATAANWPAGITQGK